jgi:hypothetical protein
MNLSFCWWCGKDLVGPGGIAGREPLYFRIIKIKDNKEVRVHKMCEATAKEFFIEFSANTPTGP